MRQHLPRQFDDATTRTIELIDVLWLRGNTIVAAFEVESITVIYSGLLRMADLLAMQPNLNIPLYVVAPEERRGKVIAEVNRPTFSRLTPPLKDACRLHLVRHASRAPARARAVCPNRALDGSRQYHPLVTRMIYLGLCKQCTYMGVEHMFFMS